MTEARANVRRRRIAIIALALAAAAVALVAATLAGRERIGEEPADALASFDDVNARPGSGPERSVVAAAVDRAYDGTHSIRASVERGQPSPYARAQLHVRWEEGEDVWYGAAFFLSPGFEGSGDYVALMRWDNYEPGKEDVSRGGIAIWAGDGRAHVFRERDDVEGQDELLEPFTIPEGRWIWIEVRQRFSSRDGDAVTELWLDDERVGSSTDANFYGAPITRVRFGVVATGGSPSRRLELWFDRAGISSSRRGPA